MEQQQQHGGVVNKTVQLGARITPEMDEAIRAAAHRDRVRPSQWVREALEERLARGGR